MYRRTEEHLQGRRCAELVFQTRIRDNVRLAEAPSYGQPVISYAPSSNGSKDYMELAKEVMARGG